VIEIGGKTYDQWSARERMQELDAEHPGRAFPDDVTEEWNALAKYLGEIERRREVIAELAKNPANREDPPEWAERAGITPRQTRDDALRTLDRYRSSDELSAEACDRVDEVLRGPDAELGVDARYVAAAGDPAYRRAFGKLLKHGHLAPMRMTSEEQQAVQRVNAAEETRAMFSGTGSAGGFALPIAIDPSVTLSSNGAINPFRQVATVRTMSTRELRLVTSDGVVAQYQAEGAEALDNSPTLVQPTLIAQRATSFVPFTLEVDQDWSTIEAELTQLIADAKDVLEATKFLSGAGSGSNEPVGLLAVGTTGSLTTTQRVQTATIATFAIADVYSLKQALPARFMPEARWMVNPNTTDVIWQFVAAGSTTAAPIMPETRDAILGKPLSELSTMATGATTGTKIAVFGDLRRAFTIGDRLGMSVELVPHLLGATNRYPIGMRGLYAIWRNDSRVVVPNAARYLEAK
jgi:HK97 family phage major capsid protein